jgi:hypothetical protein
MIDLPRLDRMTVVSNEIWLCQANYRLLKRL